MYGISSLFRILFGFKGRASRAQFIAALLIALTFSEIALPAAAPLLADLIANCPAGCDALLAEVLANALIAVVCVLLFANILIKRFRDCRLPCCLIVIPIIAYGIINHLPLTVLIVSGMDEQIFAEQYSFLFPRVLLGLEFCADFNQFCTWACPAAFAFSLIAPSQHKRSASTPRKALKPSRWATMPAAHLAAPAPRISSAQPERLAAARRIGDHKTITISALQIMNMTRVWAWVWAWKETIMARLGQYASQASNIQQTAAHWIRQQAMKIDYGGLGNQRLAVA